MNRINYSLITALYDTKGSDLYSDIYFPIIKYEVVKQYYKQTDGGKFYTLDQLQSLIDESFGIKIPLVVLKQTIKKIDTKDKDITIYLFEGGNQFEIKKAWDISINTSINNKSYELSLKYKKLEDLYKQFLEIESLPYEKSFIDLYSDNTEEIFKYIENDDGGSTIDERYVNLARFLKWLKENDSELYNIANDIFWGSVVAGFLMRNTADINIKPQEKVEYYLDSALVLAILDLDSHDNVKYAKELLEIIKSSGNIPKVHTLTIREISNILSSVEKDQGPRANSAIEEAYYRRNLTPTKILRIKNELTYLIANEGLVIFPINDTELDRIEIEYRKKNSVRELGEFRKSNLFNINGLRDIHDVYLRDFIKRKRANIAHIEKITSYFVSLNKDLIQFGNKDNQSYSGPIIIHPSKVVIDLWLHNSKSSIIKKNGLTEVMSRCFALNNTDIRSKLKIVSQYYKESDSDYSDEDYRAVCTALINRSTRALKEVDTIIRNEEENFINKEETNRRHVQVLIKISVDEISNKDQSSFSLVSEKERLAKELVSKQQSLKSSETEIKEDKKLINQLKQDLKNQKIINRISEEINEKSNELSKLERSKNKSIFLFKFYFIIFLEISLLSACLLFSTIFILQYFKQQDTLNFKNYFFQNLKTFIPAFLAGAISVCKIQTMYLFSPKITFARLRKEQIQYWIDNNPKYNVLKRKLSNLEDEREKLMSLD